VLVVVRFFGVGFLARQWHKNSWRALAPNTFLCRSTSIVVRRTVHFTVDHFRRSFACGGGV